MIIDIWICSKKDYIIIEFEILDNFTLKDDVRLNLVWKEKKKPHSLIWDVYQKLIFTVE